MDAQLQRATELLDAVRDDLPRKLPDPTFLEIADYPHLENVSSNILAFFLDPKERHGLGPLCIDALFAILGVVGSGSDAAVEREVTTDTGKRIDLVIETATHLIGIENKIYHGDWNPFDDYAAFLKKRASGSKKSVLLVLLALRPGPSPGYGFQRMSYRRFIAEVRSRPHGDHESEKYRILFDDFVNTIENLEGGTIMEPAWTKLFETRRSDLQALLAHTSAFKEKLRERVKQLGKMVDIKGQSNVKQWNWCEKHHLHDVLVHDITCADGLSVAVDTVASPTGWTLELVVMTTFQTRTISPSGMPRLRDRLAELGIPYEDAPTVTDPSGNGDVRCIYTPRFGFGDDPAIVAEHLQGIIGKLATKTSATVSGSKPGKRVGK